LVVRRSLAVGLVLAVCRSARTHSPISAAHYPRRHSHFRPPLLPLSSPCCCLATRPRRCFRLFSPPEAAPRARPLSASSPVFFSCLSVASIAFPFFPLRSLVAVSVADSAPAAPSAPAPASLLPALRPPAPPSHHPSFPPGSTRTIQITMPPVSSPYISPRRTCSPPAPYSSTHTERRGPRAMLVHPRLATQISNGRRRQNTMLNSAYTRYARPRASRSPRSRSRSWRPRSPRSLRALMASAYRVAAVLAPLLLVPRRLPSLARSLGHTVPRFSSC